MIENYLQFYHSNIDHSNPDGIISSREIMCNDFVLTKAKVRSSSSSPTSISKSTFFKFISHIHSFLVYSNLDHILLILKSYNQSEKLLSPIVCIDVWRNLRKDLFLACSISYKNMRKEKEIKAYTHIICLISGILVIL